MRNLSKEFIVKNQNKTLKETFPEAFQGFTGWVKTKESRNENYLMYFEEDIIQYGFNGLGDWCVNALKIYRFNSETDFKATDEEVKFALLAEALKRGYNKGLLIEDLYNGCASEPDVNITSDFLDYETIKAGANQGQMALRDSDGNIIFHNGIWAKIQKVMTKEEAEAKFNIVIR